MRNRPRPDDHERQLAEEPTQKTAQARQQELGMTDHPKNDARQEKAPAHAQERVRVPKIQYRFLKDLEENGLTERGRKSALQMIDDKIKQFPVTAKRVMDVWMKFTGHAIVEFKEGRGDQAEREKTHEAYAAMFAAVKNGPKPKDELRAIIQELPKRTSPVRASRSERPQPTHNEQPATLVRKAERSEPEPAKKTNVAPGRDVVPAERERLTDADIQTRMSTALRNLRSASDRVRAPVEAMAVDLLASQVHTSSSARIAFRQSIEELQQKKTSQKSIEALTLAAVALTKDQRTLEKELRAIAPVARKRIAADAQERIETYSADDEGIARAARDAIRAAVKEALDPTGDNRREALVAAETRRQMDMLADPSRATFEEAALDLASDLL